MSFGSWWWTGKPGVLQSIGSQRVGHDWVTLTFTFKETREIYSENHKTLMKEIKDDTNKWKDIKCFWIEKSNTMKWLYPQRQSTDWMQPYQIAMAFFKELKMFKFLWKHKNPWIATTILKKIPDFKTHYMATVIKQCGIGLRKDM